MAFSNQPSVAETSGLLQAQFAGPARCTSLLKPIFFGSGGLRAGWRLLVYLAMTTILLAGFVLIRAGGVRAVLEQEKHMAQVIVTPRLMAGSEAGAFLIICAAALVMGKIERRKFREYGLPWQQAFGKQFWIGWFSGFAAISSTLGTMFLLRGFRVTGLALHGTAILSSLLGWSIAFILVGLFEEFLCRGYAQYTLASGIGFWPAALVISGLFGFTHAFNPNETVVGAISAGLFGLLFCLFLRRRGNLWMAVGFHAAWDWGQMFYGVADSGIPPYHNVLSSTFSGPQWLTGGTVGPEASILTPIALIVVAWAFSRHYRTNRRLLGTVDQGRSFSPSANC